MSLPLSESFNLLVILSLLANFILSPASLTVARSEAVETAVNGEPSVARPASATEATPDGVAGSDRGTAGVPLPAPTSMTSSEVWLGLMLRPLAAKDDAPFDEAHDAPFDEAHDAPFDEAHDVTIASDVTWYTETMMLGDLTIADGATLTLAGPSGTRLTAGDLRVVAGGSLIVSGTAIIMATNVTVEAGASLSADGLGYGASAGPGAGADGTEPFQQAGGGGHGGRGGAGSDGDAPDQAHDVYLPLVVRNGSGAHHHVAAHAHPGGQPYDDAGEPKLMGSGGGSTSSAPGGAGGGALRLVVNDTLIVNGDLSANGLAGSLSPSKGAGGGGAGGSVWIEAGAFGGSGTLRVDGGEGGGAGLGNTYGQGGGGAGGRVAIYARDNVFTSTGGTISAAGGSGYEAGEAGSIYVSSSAMPLLSLALDRSGLASVLPGDDITYTLRVSNEGTLPASGLTVTDTLPTEVIWVTTLPSATY